MADDDAFIVAIEEEEEEEESGVSEEDREKFFELINQIKERCEAASLKIEEDEGGDFEKNYDIYFPEKRTTRSCTSPATPRELSAASSWNSRSWRRSTPPTSRTFSMPDCSTTTVPTW